MTSKNIFLFVIILFFASNIFAQTAPIVYVSADGTGDFNCDGTSDQVEINQALDFVAENEDLTTVYLKGPATYSVDGTIFISSNTILEGDSTAKIKLIDNAGWPQFQGIIMQKGAVFDIGIADTTNAVHDIIIRGFEIDGNRINQNQPSGNGYVYLIKLQNCYNITINNMYLHDALAECVNIQSCCYGYNINFDFHDNFVTTSGHDGVYVGLSENFKIHDNVFLQNRTDAHIRAQDCNHFKIYNNIAGNNPFNRFSGGIGVDIQAKGEYHIDDCEIYNNYLFGRGSFHGIWLWQTSKGGDLNQHTGVHIHHNIIIGYQGSGIAIYGFNNTLIENNIIELNGHGDNRAMFARVPKGRHSGITFYEGADGNKVKGFTTIVRNNIIGNNAGYGIDNKKPNLNTFVLEYNDVYNNQKGNYNNTFSKTDIHVFPDYASDDIYIDELGRYDYAYYFLQKYWADSVIDDMVYNYKKLANARLLYHLKSEEGRWNGYVWVMDTVTSYCINMGNPVSDYTSEPYPNGQRINIGAFGGTLEASMGIDIPDVNGLGVYPNPTTGIINFSDELLGNEYFLYNISGQMIKYGVINSKSLNFSNLPSGFYIIKIKNYKLRTWKTVKIVIRK